MHIDGGPPGAAGNASDSETFMLKLRQQNLPSSFWMLTYKVVPCPYTYRHNWTQCPFAHSGETARRRDPLVCAHSADLCPRVRSNKPCPDGDRCPYAHNLFEQWLHPARYRTRLCYFGERCNRSTCFFAHNMEELRTAPAEGGLPMQMYATPEELAAAIPAPLQLPPPPQQMQPPPQHGAYGGGLGPNIQFGVAPPQQIVGGQLQYGIPQQVAGQQYRLMAGLLPPVQLQPVPTSMVRSQQPHQQQQQQAYQHPIQMGGAMPVQMLSSRGLQPGLASPQQFGVAQQPVYSSNVMQPGMYGAVRQSGSSGLGAYGRDGMPLGSPSPSFYSPVGDSRIQQQQQQQYRTVQQQYLPQDVQLMYSGESDLQQQAYQQVQQPQQSYQQQPRQSSRQQQYQQQQQGAYSSRSGGSEYDVHHRSSPYSEHSRDRATEQDVRLADEHAQQRALQQQQQRQQQVLEDAASSAGQFLGGDATASSSLASLPATPSAALLVSRQSLSGPSQQQAVQGGGQPLSLSPSSRLSSSMSGNVGFGSTQYEQAGHSHSGRFHSGSSTPVGRPRDISGSGAALGVQARADLLANLMASAGSAELVEAIQEHQRRTSEAAGSVGGSGAGPSSTGGGGSLLSEGSGINDSLLQLLLSVSLNPLDKDIGLHEWGRRSGGYTSDPGEPATGASRPLISALSLGASIADTLNRNSDPGEALHSGGGLNNILFTLQQIAHEGLANGDFVMVDGQLKAASDLLSRPSGDGGGGLPSGDGRGSTDGSLGGPSSYSEEQRHASESYQSEGAGGTDLAAARDSVIDAPIPTTSERSSNRSVGSSRAANASLRRHASTAAAGGEPSSERSSASRSTVSALLNPSLHRTVSEATGLQRTLSNSTTGHKLDQFVRQTLIPQLAEAGLAEPNGQQAAELVVTLSRLLATLSVKPAAASGSASTLAAAATAPLATPTPSQSSEGAAAADTGAATSDASVATLQQP